VLQVSKTGIVFLVDEIISACIAFSSLGQIKTGQRIRKVRLVFPNLTSIFGRVRTVNLRLKMMWSMGIRWVRRDYKFEYATLVQGAWPPSGVPR